LSSNSLTSPHAITTYQYKQIKPRQTHYGVLFIPFLLQPHVLADKFNGFYSTPVPSNQKEALSFSKKGLLNYI
jgi:hypothetical protein